MPSTINISLPASGVPTVSSVRENFAAAANLHTPAALAALVYLNGAIGRLRAQCRRQARVGD